MPCFFPNRGWLSRSKNASGKRSVVFSPAKALLDKPMLVDCGQCTGCRMKMSQEWALRSMHEAHYYDYNLFVTLTFSESKLHKRGRFREDKARNVFYDRTIWHMGDYTPIEWLSKYSVDVRDIQLFMKKLRQHFKYKGADGINPIRFFHCGEYGECCRVCGKSKSGLNKCQCRVFYPSVGRPHYHMCLFNCAFDDMQFYKTNKQGNPLYTSPTLEKLWGNGFAPFGHLTYKSAAYTARYVLKKLNGKLVDEPDRFGLLPYQRLDVNTGIIHNVDKEYTTMSRRDGVGARWLKEYWREVYPHDYIVFNGQKHSVPRYYDKLMEDIDPHMLQRVKNKRLQKARELAIENTPERLAVRKAISDAQLNMLTREDL